MISVVIIGKGNVGTHLMNEFEKVQQIDCLQVSSRNIGQVPKADIAILAVSDDAISEVSEKIDTRLVVHTSGASDIHILKNSRCKGVFYPLQTFSKSQSVDFMKIPICIEAESEKDYKLLESLGNLISEKVFRITSQQREMIHIAAVFANNFTNHLFQISNEICNAHEIPFEILHPLMEETVKKLNELSPQEAQTGPAIRRDQKTIKKHLFLLPEKYRNLYTIFTESIQNGD